MDQNFSRFLDQDLLAVKACLDQWVDILTTNQSYQVWLIFFERQVQQLLGTEDIQVFLMQLLTVFALDSDKL